MTSLSLLSTSGLLGLPYRLQQPATGVGVPVFVGVPVLVGVCVPVGVGVSVGVFVGVIVGLLVGV
jgi:hypothetical protein